MNKKELKEIDEFDLGELTEITIDNRKYKQMWNDLIQVEGFSEYLKHTMALDMKRHFYTSKESQERIKGHYDLASYLLKTLTFVKSEKIKETLDKKE